MAGRRLRGPPSFPRELLGGVATVRRSARGVGDEPAAGWGATPAAPFPQLRPPGLRRLHTHAGHPKPGDHIRESSRHPKRRQPKMAVKILLPVLTAVAILTPAAHAEPAPENSGQNPVFRTAFDQPTNVPGKSLVGVTVSYPPGAKSGAHHHAKSAFIMAYVISGAIRSQVEGEAARVYHAGETWTESPGAHHTISENASATEPAELLAVFLLDTGDSPLTTDDNAPG